MKFEIDYLVSGLKKKVAEKKMEALTKWIEKLNWCLERMDEVEYGRDFLHNITVSAGLSQENYKEINDRIVNNTQVQMCRELADIMGVKRHPVLQMMAENVKETVMPDGKWMLREYRLFMCKNKHSVTFQVVNEKGTTEEMLRQKFEKAIQLMKQAGMITA